MHVSDSAKPRFVQRGRSTALDPTARSAASNGRSREPARVTNTLRQGRIGLRAHEALCLEAGGGLSRRTCRQQLQAFSLVSELAVGETRRMFVEQRKRSR